MPGILLNSFTAVASRHRRCTAGSGTKASPYYHSTSMDSSYNSRHSDRHYYHDSSSSSTSSRSTAPNSALNTPERSSSPIPQARTNSNGRSQRPVPIPSETTSSATYHSRHASLWGTEIPNTEPHMTWGQFIDFDTSSSSY